MIRKYIIKTSDEMIKLGEIIGSKLFPSSVITLLGDLGAGKTTLTKGIGKALGITKTINSPTFTIMKVYEGKMMLYHMDVYRLSEASGDEYLEEYFSLGGVSVIEWAQNIEYLLPEEQLRITINTLSSEEREVILESDDIKYEKIIESVEI